MLLKSAASLAFATACLAAVATAPAQAQMAGTYPGGTQMVTNGPQADQGDTSPNWSARQNVIESSITTNCSKQTAVSVTRGCAGSAGRSAIRSCARAASPPLARTSRIRAHRRRGMGTFTAGLVVNGCLVL